MKRILVAFVCVACALAITAQAQEKKNHKMTDEQKTLRKELLQKYDANKDGKLDKEEKAKISSEDKEKMKKAGLVGKKGKKDKEEK